MKILGNKQGELVLLSVPLLVILFLLMRDGEEGDESRRPNAKSAIVLRVTPNAGGGEKIFEEEAVSDLSEQYLQNYGSNKQQALQDLEEVAAIFDDYRTVAGPANPLPTRGNSEMVQFLSGENPSGFRYLSMSGPAVNPSGELVDRWGNPLYLHFVSSEEIEIRSAGVDGEMWTDDDLLAGQPQVGSPRKSR